MPAESKPTNKGNLPPTRRACSNCGYLGHLATTCTKLEKAHVKLGVEVEGYWLIGESFQNVKSVAERWHMGSDEDGSLRFVPGHVGYEFKTRPGSLGEAISQLVAVYPDAVNHYCGMHVHMSFKSPLDIATLATREFYEFFEARWHAWGRAQQIHPDSQFWPRLRGENQYCRRNLTDGPFGYETPRGGDRSRYSITDHDRYRMLNFSAWDRHKTVECRLLPMFRDARLGVLALEELVDIIETWFAARAGAMLESQCSLDSTDMLVAGVEGFLLTEEHELTLPSLTPDVDTLEVGWVPLPPVTDGFRRIPASSYAEEMERIAQAAIQGVL
jgi:hypothetical protein